MPIRIVTTEERDRHVVDGTWGTQRLFSLLDANAAAHPDRLAVADQHVRLSYQEFADRSKLLAGWLAGLGLPRGSVVALQAGSSALIPLMHFACDRADLTFLPLSDAWRDREVGHLLATSEARVLIVPDDAPGFSFTSMVRRVRPELPDLRVVATPSPGDADTDLTAALEHASPFAGDTDASPDEPRMCMVTSGTSGMPKISLYTDNNLRFFLNVYFATVMSDGPETFANLAPANTGSTGYLFPVLTPLLFGSSCVMLEHWNPVRALELLEQNRVTVAVAVPTQTIKMLDEYSERPTDLSTLRGITNAGAPLPPKVAEAVERAFGCHVLPMYGATDGGVPAMTTVADPPAARLHSVGRIVENTEFRIAGADDTELPPGEVGEIQWRNAMKTLGYLNDPDQTDAVWTEDGLYRSGDLGRIDGDGYLHVVGRLKDLIIRGGQNISPREIEDVAIGMEEIVEVAVLGTPDPVYGEQVCMCVVTRSNDLTLDRVADYLLGRGLPQFMVPERLETFTEFPANSGGKISKDAIRSLVEQRHTQKQTDTEDRP